MKNDPTSNYAMARVYRTAVAVSALIISSSLAFAADPPVPRSNVSVNVNPTTGYYSTSNTTLRLPNGVSASAAKTSAGLPVVTKYPNGLQQSLPTGITIDAIKKTAPLSVVVRASTQSVKRAATGCLTSAKCNVALLLAGEGLIRLFDGLDWVMGEGGKAQFKPQPAAPTDPQFLHYSIYYTNNVEYPSMMAGSPEAACMMVNGHRYSNGWVGNSAVYDPSYGTYGYCRFKINTATYGLSVNRFGSGCPSNLTNVGGSCVDLSAREPVPAADIASGVESNYIPEPSDWPALTPELKPDDIEITWAPTLQGEPKTTTEYDADGNPHKIRETNIWYDFDIRDNPSPQPKLDVKKREETKTFEDGVLTGTSTTESTESAGSDDTPQPPPESPIDCDLFPTACAWFDWTREEPVEPDNDLSPLLQEVAIDSKTFTITGGVAACPAPLVLDLSVFGSREVSYQPLCDLASTMKFLYLALMSFAAAVLLNRSINRV